MKRKTGLMFLLLCFGTLFAAISFAALPNVQGEFDQLNAVTTSEVVVATVDVVPVAIESKCDYATIEMAIPFDNVGAGTATTDQLVMRTTADNNHGKGNAARGPNSTTRESVQPIGWHHAGKTVAVSGHLHATNGAEGSGFYLDWHTGAHQRI